MDIEDLRVRLFCDSGNFADILEMAEDPFVSGFTTNPSLLRKSGVTDYMEFARKVTAAVPNMPISFEVLSDDMGEMRREALMLSGVSDNVFVKVPVTNARGKSTLDLIRELGGEGVQLNVTAVFSFPQINAVARALPVNTPSFLSVFAGRIADTWRDPKPYISHALDMVAGKASWVIWASSRESYNILDANRCGCHVITVFPELLRKLKVVGKNLEEFSLETVQMFSRDAQAAGLSI